MKKPFAPLLLALTLFFLSCSTKKPIDYYNACAGAANMSSSIFTDLGNKLDRLFGNGYLTLGKNNFGHYQTLMAHNETLLEKLETLKGNAEADPMILATMALVEHAIALSKKEELRQLFKILENAQTADEAIENYQPFDGFVNEAFTKHDVLFETYYRKMSQYAEKNGIDEKLWKLEGY